MDNKSIQQGLSITRMWKILGMLILVSAVGGCIGKESKADADLSAQKIVSENISDASTNASVPKENQLRVLLRPSQLNKTGMLPVTLRITNPRMNETVLTVFKPQYGQEWYNQTRVTSTNNNNWTQNFTIRPRGNVSYVRMFVQVSYNNTVIKRGTWNITLEAPVGKAS